MDKNDFLIPVYTVPSGASRLSGLAPEHAAWQPWTALSARARVPEHSVPLVQALSGGSPLVVNGYLFFTGEDWITCVGYPLEGSYNAETFILAADRVGDDLLVRQRAAGRPDRTTVDMFAIAPELPAEAIRNLGGEISERDAFFVLPADAAVPTPLRRAVRQARTALRVEEGSEFTPAHRRLWSEMLTRPAMRTNVRELYAKTGQLARKNVPGVFFLNAWDAEGHLAASLLIDSSPETFCSYIIGAHSRRKYTPHATDLLFATLLEKARSLGKTSIHLGLGVNEGIRRFKRKWGGREDLPFVMASWKHAAEADGLTLDLREALQGFLRSGTDLTKQQLFDALPQQRPLAMLWNLEKNGARSWIGGTAHFFLYSFTEHFEILFNQVDTVIFEGPMDEESMALFTAGGTARRPDDPDLLAMLSPTELSDLKRMVEGPQNPVLRRLQGNRGPSRIQVEDCLATCRPWYAFFSLWTAFLERQGWKQSVDLEAWNLAHEMGKAVVPMETHEEQLASLESVPAERIINFFRQCRQWPAFSRINVRSYLLGDLGRMSGTSTEFPTRGVHTVFNVRDERFVERMMPFVEQGRSITLVGSAHLLGMRDLLRQRGVLVRKQFPSPWHRFKCRVAQRIHGPASDFA